MFAYKPFKKSGTIDIAILTDANQYIEYTLDFRLLCLTKYVSRRVRSLFEPYLIDKATDIMVSPMLDEDHPLYQYFMMLRQHIGFKLSTVDVDRAVNRIHYYYTRKTATKSKFNSVWKKVIESGQCPWITKEIDYALMNKGKSTAYRIKVSRMTMFYIVVKNYLYKLTSKAQKNSTK